MASRKGVKLRKYPESQLKSAYDAVVERGISQCKAANEFKVLIQYNHSIHSEKKGCQNGAPGVLLIQMIAFFSKGNSFFSLIIMFETVPLGTEIVPPLQAQVPICGWLMVIP